MSVYRTSFAYLCLTFLLNLVHCTEFVPVYMWSTQRSNEKAPALHKINQDTFRDDMLEQLRYYDFIVVFAEKTLSPEDFAQRDQTGNTLYPHLDKLRKSSKITYLPYVENPVKALRHLDVSVSETSVSDLNENFETSKTEIFIINLNDAADFENRVEMLKRHDALINDIYTKISNSEKKVLAIYTAYHESWIGSEDIINTRRTRSILAADGEASNNFYSDSLLYLYLTQAHIYEKEDLKSNVSFTFSSQNVTDGGIQLDMTSTADNIKVSLLFSTQTSYGYWELAKVSMKNLSTNADSPLNASNSVYSQKTFSYHCGDQIFVGENNFKLLLKDFQVQLFFNGSLNETRFSDAYDCVGFTSVPIWSGIFVVAILLIILSFGITMMMDIRTMDRFDDSKGKTITINTAE